MSDTLETLYHIADSIRETGNDPYDQLLGYISTGDVTYITRRNNARELIQTVDKKDVKQFIEDICNEFDYSRGYLNKRFQAETDSSFDSGDGFELCANFRTLVL